MSRQGTTLPKPLLGFGIVGWIAVPVLIALTLMVLAGFDFVTAYVYLVMFVLGPDGMLSYIAGVHSWHGISLRGPVFNLVSVMSCILALRIYPRRVAFWRYALVILWGVIHPLSYWYGWVTAPLIEALGNWSIVHRRAPELRNHCKFCEYELRGLTTITCPECGR